jgi:hypothetical protein
MEFVTVTCDRDIHQQILQSMSMDRFIQDPCYHYIVVESRLKPINEWQALLEPYYTKHTLILIDGHSPDIRNICGKYINGYYRQQILKLYISKIIKSDYYTILDSKDLFIKHLSTVNWPIIEGNNKFLHFMNGEYPPGTLVYKQWCDLIETTTGITKPLWAWYLHTPFRCKTEICKNIVDSLDINKLFDGLEYPSEFILYRYFTDTGFNPILHQDSLNDRFSVQFWENLEIPEFDNILRDRRTYLVSFHRFFIAKNKEKIDKIKLKLVDIGLDSSLVERAFDYEYWIKNIF